MEEDLSISVSERQIYTTTADGLESEQTFAIMKLYKKYLISICVAAHS